LKSKRLKSEEKSRKRLRKRSRRKKNLKDLKKKRNLKRVLLISRVKLQFHTDQRRLKILL
jgi:hypothetical protein